jgi:signal transduction histidine kinase
MACSLRSWLTLVILIFGTVSPAAAEPKRVLLLHSFGPQFVPWVFIAGQLREELFKQSPDKIDLYEASLEGARFQQLEEQGPLVEYLTALFGSRKPDLIITIGVPAAIFAQKYRAQLFPFTPLVIGAVEQRGINYTKLTSNDAPVSVTLDFTKWIENILEVIPDTKHIAWIVGGSPLERFWTEEFRRTSQPFSDKVSFEWFNDLSFDEMQKRISQLPPHSAAFFVDLRVDGAGVPLDRETVLPKLRAATNAPIFSYVGNYLGQGIVGGPLMSSEEQGRRIAEAALRILKGEVPADLKIPPLTSGASQYDWRELQHWNISEDQLPPGSIVRFREPGMWQQYHSQIALVAGIILAQGALIFGLMFERRRRVHAEVQSRQRSAELAHINRVAMAGELTATIAHELNQPLGAILTNVETARLIVKSPTPDLEEVDEVLADIQRDDVRASEVIGRLRAQLKKTPLELKDIDLNEVAEETSRFLSALAVARKVNLTSSIAPAPLPIKGDRIQLQQVTMNLIVNAMDAMSSMPSTARRITVSTARDGNSAYLSVSDIGPGIPTEKLDKVFEPFFTTKGEGMGMGLSIARTIVGAHGGQISAENEAGRGATFRITLPLTKQAS